MKKLDGDSTSQGSQQGAEQNGAVRLKRGSRFLHSRFITTDHKPLECVVTRTARGIVYWRAVEGGSPYCFSDEEFTKYVREVL